MKLKSTKRSLKNGFIFIAIGIAAIIFTYLVAPVLATNIDSEPLALYMYPVALSTFILVGIILLYDGYRDLKPIPLTTAERYFYEIFKEMSESGEKIENYVEFHEIRKRKVGYKLKKAKFDWDFEKVISCFADLDPTDKTIALILSIWLGVGGFIILVLLPPAPSDGSWVFAIAAFIVVFTMLFALAYLLHALRGVLPYISIRNEFINAQKLQVNKLYAEANRNPNDLVHQLKVTNAQELLRRLEQIPVHPFKPLVKIVAFAPLIGGLISFLLS